MSSRQLTPRYHVSPQITPEDVPDLAAQGFALVICNRPDAEVPGELQSGALRAAVEAKDDLDYHYAHQAVLKYWLFVHVPLAYSLVLVSGLHVVLAFAFGGVS